MGEHVIKLPDVGEGVAEAELVEWHVKIGDLVREDAVIAAVMTDKATVEIPSPVDGEIIWLGAEIGETVAVGSPIVRIKIAGDGPAETVAEAAPAEPKSEARQPAPAAVEAAPAPAKKAEPAAKPPAPAAALKPVPRATTLGLPRPEGERPLASPAVRLRAKEAGIDLRQIPGTGPAGRVTHEDLDGFAARGAAVPVAGLQAKSGVEEIKVIGLRRRIAEKMALAKSRIPHITYVEEVDVTALEELRAKLNATKKPDRPKLTLLPFLMRALVKAVAEQPQLNAIYDDDAGIIHRHAGVHIGMAAQTPGGLMVPVVKHAEARDLWDCAVEVNRLAEAAKAGTATREELTGSTITITSLGAMGGVATTPVINYPEVAIVGVNKIMIRPMWDGSQFVPRKMMNLSSSFDHRVIDGWDAAVFVQRLKALLEAPAMIFVEG
ncbi:branched-chain alpha-keto acid dehydrogenase E2 component [Aminobacter aminovorans]|uniref:Dihydrolipoamide acetyltransferase component of pyruvate dehydrogenase complex n=1 Tax=Aminobacter aminovorans TaxID=83263 RepID=A0A380WGZ9_AMIAI|nr:dihydrolipoamide acetyltransferase family protein [Aminobacter aminovorans]TCS26672.1 branched-chain alpha-keto acid dehydrogenase E2 component [Aminobacter aminovorans]SUU88269.1 Lipoamide acyltransferase component of branched-chain alpha-keto acid dehydrogenase complex [Aminobacter aminovorans]